MWQVVTGVILTRVKGIGYLRDVIVLSVDGRREVSCDCGDDRL